MARAVHSYTTLAVGRCGHVVQTWPLVTAIGGKDPTAYCDTCDSWIRIEDTDMPEEKATKKRVRAQRSKAEETEFPY